MFRTAPAAQSVRHPAYAWRVWLVCLLLAACAAPRVAHPPGGGATDRVELEVAVSGGGSLLLELDRRSAPAAVAALERSFREGRWDGVEIGWIWPHTEIRTGAPAGTGEIASELDARALGLDRERIADAGRAMETIQTELEPALLRAGHGAGAQLREWVATWRAHFDAAFLVGTSRMQVNEALGYRYADGYASRPLRRGSVALVAAGTPGRSTLALALLLRDQPARDGRWVVVGEVLSGLDLIEGLSLAPRVNPKRHEPVTPARIAGISIRTPRSVP